LRELVRITETHPTMLAIPTSIASIEYNSVRYYVTHNISIASIKLNLV